MEVWDMQTTARLCKEAYPREQRRRTAVSRLSCLRFLPLMLLTAQFSDMQAREPVMEFLGGSIGEFAMDCSRGTSPDNPHQVFSNWVNKDGKIAGMVIAIK